MVGQDLGEPEDRRERGPELVAGVGEHGVLELVGVAEFGVEPVELVGAGLLGVGPSALVPARNDRDPGHARARDQRGEERGPRCEVPRRGHMDGDSSRSCGGVLGGHRLDAEGVVARREVRVIAPRLAAPCRRGGVVAQELRPVPGWAIERGGGKPEPDRAPVRDGCGLPLNGDGAAGFDGPDARGHGGPVSPRVATEAEEPVRRGDPEHVLVHLGQHALNSADLPERGRRHVAPAPVLGGNDGTGPVAARDPDTTGRIRSDAVPLGQIVYDFFDYLCQSRHRRKPDATRCSLNTVWSVGSEHSERPADLLDGS